MPNFNVAEFSDCFQNYLTKYYKAFIACFRSCSVINKTGYQISSHIRPQPGRHKNSGYLRVYEYKYMGIYKVIWLVISVLERKIIHSVLKAKILSNYIFSISLDIV